MCLYMPVVDVVGSLSLGLYYYLALLHKLLLLLSQYHALSVDYMQI
jgi:hypothetical protein